MHAESDLTTGAVQSLRGLVKSFKPDMLEQFVEDIVEEELENATISEGMVYDVISIADFLDAGENVYAAFDDHLEDIIKDLLDRSSGYLGIGEDFIYQVFIWDVMGSLKPNYPKSLKMCTDLISYHIKYIPEYARERISDVESYLDNITDDELVAVVKTVLDSWGNTDSPEELCSFMDFIEKNYSFDSRVLEALDEGLSGVYGGKDLSSMSGRQSDECFGVFEENDAIKTTFPETSALFEAHFAEIEKVRRERSELLRTEFEKAGVGITPWPYTYQDMYELNMFQAINFVNDLRGTIEEAVEEQRLVMWFKTHFPDIPLFSQPHRHRSPPSESAILRAAVLKGRPALEADPKTPSVVLKALDSLLDSKPSSKSYGGGVSWD